MHEIHALCRDGGAVSGGLLGLAGQDGLLLLGHVGQRLAEGDATVERSQERIDIVQVGDSDIGQELELGGDLLDLVVGHLHVQLLGSRLDAVPSSQTGGDVDVAGHAEVGGVDDLVGGGVVEDGLGVDTGLVGEGTETSDVVVEGDVDLDGLGDELLNVLELVELVLAHDVVAVGDDHAGHQATKRGDTVTLTNTEHGGVDVGRTSLKGTVGVGNSATGVVVEMGLNVAAHNSTEGPDQIVDLSGRSTANSVGNTNTVDTNLVNGGVDGEQVNQV